MTAFATFNSTLAVYCVVRPSIYVSSNWFARTGHV